MKEISISQNIAGVSTERKFLMHLPTNFDFEDVYPVIFFLHGRGGKMEQFPGILINLLIVISLSEFTHKDI